MSCRPFAVGGFGSYKPIELCDDQAKSNEMPMKQRAICAGNSYQLSLLSFDLSMMLAMGRYGNYRSPTGYALRHSEKGT